MAHGGATESVVSGSSVLSQDEFWKKWTAGGVEQPSEKKEEKPVTGDPLAGLDADTLSAWLKGTPGAESLVPAIPPPLSPAAPSSDLASTWPPQKPVDPFTGIQPQGGTSAGNDWDLALDLSPPKPVPASTSPAPAKPFFGSAPSSEAPAHQTPSAPWSVAPAGTPVAPVPATPAAGATPIPAANDFGGFDLGGLGGLGGGGATPGSTSSPFGPPPPPPQPPAEALQAAPLRLRVETGRRSTELKIQGEALIGRPDPTRGINPEIDLRLDDAVSRRHAKIFLRDGRYVVTDLNSTNGTRHNETWVQPEMEIELSSGDIIRVGEQTKIHVLDVPSQS